MGCCGHSVWPNHQTESHSQSQGRDYPHDVALWEAREAHQWALEATCMLELNIERVNQEADGAKHQCPCSHSHHCSRSLGRHVRYPSWHRLERHMTSCKPVEDTSSDERPQREPREHFTRGKLGEGNLGLCLP